MYNYQSDATKFINEYLKEHPQESEQRLEHRRLLWDVELNPEEEAGFQAAAVPKKPYTYETE